MLKISSHDFQLISRWAGLGSHAAFRVRVAAHLWTRRSTKHSTNQWPCTSFNAVGGSNRVEKTNAPTETDVVYEALLNSPCGEKVAAAVIGRSRPSCPVGGTLMKVVDGRGSANTQRERPWRPRGRHCAIVCSPQNKNPNQTNHCLFKEALSFFFSSVREIVLMLFCVF